MEAARPAGKWQINFADAQTRLRLILWMARCPALSTRRSGSLALEAVTSPPGAERAACEQPSFFFFLEICFESKAKT